MLIHSKAARYIGFGSGYALALEGSLKIAEATALAPVVYEMEEFMHGVYHSIDQDTYLLYLGCPGKHYQRMVNMMKYFGERDHAHNYMVTSEKEQESKENFVYPFQNDPYFASMEYVVPLQVIARKLSLDLGIDCNISSDPNFHKKMGSYTY